MLRLLRPRLHQARVLGTLWLILLPGLLTANVITVTTGSDGARNGIDCELRDAIEAANTDDPVGGCVEGSGDDEIHFASGILYILLAADLPEITSNVEILGQGQDFTLIDGDDAFSILHFAENTVGAVRQLQLFQGFSNTAPSFIGVCLTSEGTRIVVEDVRIDTCENASSSSFAAPVVFDTSESAELRRSTLIGNVGKGSALLVGTSGEFIGEDLLFHGNRSTSSVGALVIGGSIAVTIRRSTFTANEGVRGAAITLVSPVASILLEHSTVAGNLTVTDPSEAAVSMDGMLTLFNSIIAGNTNEFASPGNSPDLVAGASSTLISLGHNILGTNDGDGGGEEVAAFPLGLPNVNDDYVGQVSDPLEPELGPIQNNGGPTNTMMPSLSSTAIDRGSCPGEIADQRGYLNPTTGTRPVDQIITNVDDGCDIGAVELGARELPLFGDGFESGDTVEWSSGR